MKPSHLAPDYEVVGSEQPAKLQAIAAACTEADCRKVLIRGGTAKVRLTPADIYDLGQEIARLRLRVAIVNSPDASKANEGFLKDVAKNRGSAVQFFGNEQGAKDWLRV